MKQFRWGIISTARINRRLIPVIKASERGALIGVAGRNSARTQAYAKEWEIPKAYDGYTALVEDPDIDIIYISLPNDLHTEWTVRALNAGKHVLCEKPLCLTLDQLTRIRKAGEQSGRYVMEAFMYRHHPQTGLFKQIVESGEIGELVGLQSEFTAVFSRSEDNYRLFGERGGGALWDIGVYPVSFFHFLDTSDVQGVAGTAKLEGGIDRSFWGRMDFTSGVTGQFFVSFDSEYSTRTAIMGSSGRLDITHPYNATDECQARVTRGGKVRQLDLPKQALYSGEVEQMHDLADGLNTPVFTLDDSQRCLETILQLRSAAGMGKVQI